MVLHLDADLADVALALEMPERGAQLGERVRAVDRRPDGVLLHGRDHGGELVAIADGNSAQARGLHDQDREAEIVPGAADDADYADGPAHANGAERLRDRAAAADLDHEVDALGHVLQHALAPLGVVRIVDNVSRAESAQLLELRRAR